ncbi:MAG: HAD-IIB family hydrolase [Candidatus Heimdallarchaeota archaeon]|nr:HAD-IIB family hydrolase [Candidatus Heimdallarchaeota archaeon]
MLKKKIGFLFDVDGTLTTYHRNDSIVDLLLINDLNTIRKRQFPIAFITGRSVTWLQEIFFDHIDPALQEYIFLACEYGLVTYFKGKKRRRRIDQETKHVLSEAKEKIISALCDYKELEVAYSYHAPDFRCLWVEPKEIMITIRTLPLFGLTTEKFLKIIQPIMDNYKDRLRLIPNKYAIDVLPLFATKGNAAKKAIAKLDPEGQIERWFAFGDSSADEEMGLARKNIHFYLIPQGLSSETHQLIERALAGYNNLRR